MVPIMASAKWRPFCPVQGGGGGVKRTPSPTLLGRLFQRRPTSYPVLTKNRKTNGSVRFEITPICQCSMKIKQHICTLKRQLSWRQLWCRRLQGRLSSSSQSHRNERAGVSSHRRLDCLLSCLLRRRSKETSKFCVSGIFEGNSPVTGDFRHKGLVTRKMCPFDDIIMDSVQWRHVYSCFSMHICIHISSYVYTNTVCCVAH